MVQGVSPTIDAGILVSNLIGGIIALIVAIAVSRWEFNRQQEEQKNNWYRSIHNTVVRIYGSKNVGQPLLEENKVREFAKLYKAYSDQIEDQLPHAPTDDIGLPLYNALQNVQLCCIRYHDEVQSSSAHSYELVEFHDMLMDFSLITLYIIEEEISPDIKFLKMLEDRELDEAEELYNKFKNGDIYGEQNKQIMEKMDRFQQLVDELDSE